MKKVILIIYLFTTSFLIHAQVAFQSSISQLNTAKTIHDYDILFKQFSESKTPKRWQSYYYTAVALYLKNNVLIKKGSKPSLNESNALARKYAYGALSSQPDNEELQVLLGLIFLQKLSLDTSSNIQQDLAIISEYISKVERSSPDNPRLTLLKAAMAKRNSTEKEDIEKLYQKAEKDFNTYNSSPSFAPSWGKQLLQK